MSNAIETVRTETFSVNFFRFGKGKRTLVIKAGQKNGHSPVGICRLRVRGLRHCPVFPGQSGALLHRSVNL